MELLDLTVQGSVLPLLQLSAQTVRMPNKAQRENATAKFQVYSTQLSEFEIVARSSSQFLGVGFKALDEKQLEELNAKCGYEGTVKVSPKFPAGNYDERIVISTNTDRQGEVILHVTGHVTTNESGDNTKSSSSSN